MPLLSLSHIVLEILSLLRSCIASNRAHATEASFVSIPGHVTQFDRATYPVHVTHYDRAIYPGRAFGRQEFVE